MRRLLILALTILVFLPVVPVSAEQADTNAAARSVVRVVLIQVRDDGARLVSHGTGFAVSRNRILTNNHVIEDALDRSDIAVGVIRAEGSDRWGARIIGRSPRNDLALLELMDGGALEPMTLFTGAVPDGADIVAIGYPGSVDMAQGLTARDMITPMKPVNSPGTLTQGRSSKAFATVLHTAAIGTGNSGGPLIDGCGRVIGVNSFGTIGGQADSEFYFAVAMSEVMRFLNHAEMQPKTTGSPCRSLAELQNAEQEKAKLEDERQQRAAARKEREYRDALEAARLDIMAERENGMVLGAIAFLLALFAGGGAVYFGQQRGKHVQLGVTAGLSVFFLAGAAAAWLTRPDVSEAEGRARDIAGQGSTPSSDRPRRAALEGELVCIIDMERSRMTVSTPGDVPFTWSENGCVNGRTQYGYGGDGWSRILVPNEDQTVTVAAFNPDEGVYQTRRYLLDLETMDLMRQRRGEITPPSCGAGDAALRNFGDQQSELSALLPDRPNELLVYNCSEQD